MLVAHWVIFHCTCSRILVYTSRIPEGMRRLYGVNLKVWSFPVDLHCFNVQNKICCASRPCHCTHGVCLYHNSLDLSLCGTIWDVGYHLFSAQKTVGSSFFYFSILYVGRTFAFFTPRTLFFLLFLYYFYVWSTLLVQQNTNIKKHKYI